MPYSSSAQVLALKLVPLVPWPKTKLAVTFGGLEAKGVLYSNTRLFWLSTMYRLSDLSRPHRSADTARSRSEEDFRMHYHQRVVS